MVGLWGWQEAWTDYKQFTKIVKRFINIEYRYLKHKNPKEPP
ncbi:hypothetical protein C4K08_2294 [Pseudomonas chlororaphis subsp. aureofaciens]|nr:hypothetical protein C4K17_2194 [Pseudomonas chlororaphis subsp. aurantiaca]AZE22721.1 hypothetical protein C4K08_2294 [Pseudomonas chlororaphis subsp. aureofaciens]